VIIEILLMWSMYHNRTANIAIIIAAAVVLVLSFVFIRQQTAVGDIQFLKSMIPHHSGAVLMCRKANISDPQIKRLCDDIVKSQLEEIAEMKKRLQQLRD
jgi:hypothetical protein